MDTIPITWQRRRSIFNHDWLKNQMLPALDSGHNVLQGRSRGFAYLRRLIRETVPVWEAQVKEARYLLTTFQTEMSPRRLLGVPPLSSNQDFTELFGEIIHELWLARHRVPELVSTALQAVQDADRAFERIKAAVGATDRDPITEEFTQAFEEFRNNCHSVARAIEKFPSRILVV
jgi:hypothetical protein